MPPRSTIATRRLAFAAFFGSGAAGLIYEVCWIRQASLIFGSTTFALSSVLAVFFLGLALGSELFGRIAQRTRSPLRLLVRIELALAVLGLASPFAFRLAESAYGVVYRLFEASDAADAGLVGFRLLLVALLLLPPTIAMGGTLPLICRQFVDADSRIANSVGWLYGLNTLGAAAGCVAAGLFFLPALGLQGTVALAAALNLSVAAALGLCARSLEAPEPSVGLPEAESGVASRTASRVHLLVFAAGFVALGSEVLWTRFLSLLVSNTVHTYTLTLGTVLLGIVLGSQVARSFDRVRDRAALFGWLQVAGALVILLLLLLPAAFWHGFGGSRLWIYGLLLLPPAVLQGASYPLAVRLAVSDSSRAGSGVGRLTAFNTLGGIAGSLAVGFVGLPVLGLHAMLLVLTALGVSTGALAWIGLDVRRGMPARLAWVGVSLAVWLALSAFTGTRLPGDFLGTGGELVAFYEGRASSVAVVKRDGMNHLNIDRLWQGRNARGHQALAAHVPMILHPAPRDVLIVGAGAGQTPSRFLMYPIDSLVCVDIEPAVFDAIQDHFDSDWMDDERVSTLYADGRNVLSHTARRFDVISIEVGQLVRPGVPFFYTEELYRKALERLAPGGLLSQFVPLQFLPPPLLRSVIATFLEVFPETILWYNTAELLLIGVNGETMGLGGARLELLRENAAVQRDLDYAHWGGERLVLNRPEVFVGSLLLEAGGLRELAAGVPRLVDDLPRLDYEIPPGVGFAMHEIENAELLRSHLADLATLFAGAPALDLQAAENARKENLANLKAGALLRNARKMPEASEQRVALLERAVEHQPSLTSQLLLGLARLERGEAAAAQRALEAALAIKPDHVRAQRALGRALLAQGKADEAVAVYERELSLRPRSPAIHNALGVALGRAGRAESAASHFREALRLRPGYPEALRNLEALAKRADDTGA